MSTHQNQTPRQEQQRRQEAASQSAPLEFQTAEDALRADRAAQPIPEGLEQSLAQSIQASPAKKQSLWARLFGGG